MDDVNLRELRSSERRELRLRRYLHRTCLWASLLGIFLINDRCGRAQPMMVVLDGIGKETEQSVGSQSVASASMLSVPVPASGFLP